MYVVESSGQWWLGVKTGLVRGRIEVELMGNVTPRLASMVGREILAIEGRTGREPVLLDVRAATAAIGGSVAMSLAVAFAVATSNGAPTAVVGRLGAGPAAAQQLMGARVAWFAAPAQARRWLREQMVA